MRKLFLTLGAITSVLSLWLGCRTYFLESGEQTLLDLLSNDTQMLRDIISTVSAFLYSVYDTYPAEILILGWLGVFLSAFLFIVRVVFLKTIDSAVLRAIKSKAPEHASPHTEESKLLQELKKEIAHIKNMKADFQAESSRENNKVLEEHEGANVRLDRVLGKLRSWRKEWTIVKAMVIASYETCFPDVSHRLSTSSDSSDFSFPTHLH